MVASQYIVTNDAREKWSRKLDFVLSCIGFAVGLGNIWRFPYLCYKNGGGAFFVPYIIMLVCGGIPIFVLEVGLGQYMSRGGLHAWDISPMFKGIGVGTTVILFLMNIYYIIIMAWAAFYFVMSLTTTLPWSHCNNEWNTEWCYSDYRANTTCTGSNCTVNRTFDSTVEFWERRVLQISDDIENPNGLVWELAVSLLVVWIAVFFCVWRGIKWSGKVVYFTATFPYVVLVILLIRAATLDGAGDGIIYYLKPDFSRLADAQVWLDGGTQIFFSYAIALGCMITLGSYNKFHTNFYRQTLVITVVNSGTSVLGGFVVFSVLGFMAKQQNLHISEVVDAGPGLAFITYPKAVTQMPASPIWAALFFFMIFLIGIDSQVKVSETSIQESIKSRKATQQSDQTAVNNKHTSSQSDEFVAVEGFLTNLMDSLPKHLHSQKFRVFIVGIYCTVSYLLGLSMVSRGGMYVFQLFDYYSASGIVLLFICFLESFVIGWVFGAEKMYDAIELMIGYRINRWFYICWKFITPALTMAILLFQFISFKPLVYNKIYTYPVWAQALGLMLAIVSMICVPIYAVIKILTANGSLSERFKYAKSPLLEAYQIPEKWRSNDKDMKGVIIYTAKDASIPLEVYH